jgi:DNA-directed RNA polymerase subunit omega
MEERSMFQPDLDEILSKVDCRYSLIVEIAKRARELVDGDEPLIDTDEINPVSIAIEEIDQGLIVKSNNA